MSSAKASKPITVQPTHFARPRGYANGMVGSGRILFVGGQIGWTAAQKFVAETFLEQFAQALDNVMDVVRAAGGEPSDITEMTIYVTDLAAYREAGKQLGTLWRQRLGTHYPAMALVGVSGLVEPQALVEISATALLASDSTGTVRSDFA